MLETGLLTMHITRCAAPVFIGALVWASVSTGTPVAAQGPVSDSVVSYVQAGATLARAGRYRDALATYRHAERLAPADYTIHFDVGMMLELSHEWQPAFQEFVAAHQLRPLDRAPLWHLGVTRHNGGDKVGALHWFRDACHANPNDASSCGYAGVTASELDHDSLAVAYFTHALHVQPAYFQHVPGFQRQFYLRSLARIRAPHT